jgi:hypothetical protein
VKVIDVAGEQTSMMQRFEKEAAVPISRRTEENEELLLARVPTAPRGDFEPRDRQVVPYTSGEEVWFEQRKTGLSSSRSSALRA